MQDFFGQLYIDLTNYIKANVPEVRWLDIDYGQLEHFEYRPEVSFPCVLIDFPQAIYSNTANLSQMGEVKVQLRLGFAPFSKSYQAAPDNVKEKGLAYFAIEQKLFEAIQGWNNSFTQPFIRESALTEQRDNDDQGLRVRVMTFNTYYEDNSALPLRKKVKADFIIEV
jgi:hypothetical protein